MDHVWLHLNFSFICYLCYNIRNLLNSIYCFVQGFVPAINALAWYHEQFEHDYKQAVQLWEQADFLESPDAALNLGVVYSQGLYPGKPADQVSSSKNAFCDHLLVYRLVLSAER